jgi:NADH-quinone oxidoreductase subunit K
MLYLYLLLSLLIFSIGIYGVLTRRSAIGILMSIELIFNAANINFAAFNRYLNLADSIGLIYPIFIITIAAAETAIGLAIILAIYREFKSTNVENINILKF